MKRLFFSLLLCAQFLFCFGQIIIIGHARVNNMPLQQVSVVVKQGGQTLQTLSTKESSTFKIKLNFGNDYAIVFSQANCITQYMEVLGRNVPEDKRQILMTYETDLPFFYKADGDVDSTVFKNPCHRVIYGGGRQMVDDSIYNKAFLKTVIKTNTVPISATPTTIDNLQVQVAGLFMYDEKTKAYLANKEVRLLDKNNKVIKVSRTNRYGQFVFGKVGLKTLGKIALTLPANEVNALQKVKLLSYSNALVDEQFLSAQQVVFNFSKALIDDSFTHIVGGKLIYTDSKQKTFFANKTVYLSNARNTIIKKTTTNTFGMFVFENIKPEQTYFIGVDAEGLKNGSKVDFLNKDDKFIHSLDSLAGKRQSVKFSADTSARFSDIQLLEKDMRMNVSAKLYGDNINNPLGKLKIILLNDSYEPIDSVITDDFGKFKFKYLPFLNRFFLSSGSGDNSLDVFSSILVYSNEDNLIKVVTPIKGNKLVYKPLETDRSQLKEIMIDDPWLDVLNNKKISTPIIENIQFELAKWDLLPAARQTLEKVALVLTTNKTIRLELNAHTDSKGSESDNQKLSDARAFAAKNYLMELGIAGERLISKGFGETQVLNNCRNGFVCSEEQHAQNRRIEFKVIQP